MPDVSIRKVRLDMQLSQPQFAEKFGFNIGTLRQWEQGRRHPTGAALVLLKMIACAPAAVDKILREIA